MWIAYLFKIAPQKRFSKEKKIETNHNVIDYRRTASRSSFPVVNKSHNAIGTRYAISMYIYIYVDTGQKGHEFIHALCICSRFLKTALPCIFMCQ